MIKTHEPVSPVDAQQDIEEALGEQEDLAHIKQKSVSGSLSYFGRTLLIQAIGFGSALLLSGVLTPADFGIYGFVVQIIGLLVFFSDIGLAAALIQQKKEPSLNDYRTVFTVQQLLSWFIFGVVVLIISSGYFADQLANGGMWVALALAISFPLATFKTISSIQLERELRFNILVWPQLLEQVVFHGVAVVMALQGWGVVSYAWAVLARSVLGTVAMWLLKPWSIGISFNIKSIKKLAGFGVKFQANDFLARIKDQLYFAVLAIWLSPTQFGYIQWSKTWSIYPYSLTVQNVMAVTFPTFARLQNHPRALKRAIEKSLYFISLVLIPLILGMVLLIEPVTRVIPQYNQWQPAVLTFVLFTLSIVGAGVSTPLTNVLNATGKINQTLGLMIFWTSSTWILTPVMIDWFGFTGVAMTAFVIGLSSFIPVLLVKRMIEIDVWRQLRVSAAAAITMSMLGMLMAPQITQIWQLLPAMLILGSSYGLVVLVLGWQQLLQELASLHPKVHPFLQKIPVLNSLLVKIN